MRFSEVTYLGNEYDFMIIEHLFVIDYICRNPENKNSGPHGIRSRIKFRYKADLILRTEYSHSGPGL